MKRILNASLATLTLALVISCGGRQAPEAQSAAETQASDVSTTDDAYSGGETESRRFEDMAEEEADAAGAPPPPAAPAAQKVRISNDSLVLPQPEPAPVAAPDMPHNTEGYDSIIENRFLSVNTKPLSTFSIDVDTASYSNMRRFLSQGQEPPKGAVRIEELINYFDYDYAQPRGDAPFSVNTEVSAAPWKPEHRLVHIGLQGKEMAPAEIPGRNLVFLLDVSGSMDAPNKLPLLKRSFSALLQTLNERDRVAIAVYAGASGLVLPSTPASDRAAILGALDNLSAGGSTNGASGIRLAYEVARAHQAKGGVNRVILATDGDFNVGVTSRSDLLDLIEQERKSGIFLTVLGFGMGNYKDSTLEQLADRGNGNYAYIDSFREARKVLVEEANSTLITIAKDVKIQVEFNPAVVGAYRLIGYENRKLRDEDFNDDTKDAGEIGAGHTVTALYEIVSPEQAKQLAKVDALKYQSPSKKASSSSSEIMTVKLRYKAPTGATSKLLSVPIKNATLPAAKTSDNFRFSAAVAAFGMLLRDSEYKASASYDMVRQLALGATGKDPHGYRQEFVSLVNSARGLKAGQALAR